MLPFNQNEFLDKTLTFVTVCGAPLLTQLNLNEYI